MSISRSKELRRKQKGQPTTSICCWVPNASPSGPSGVGLFAGLLGDVGPLGDAGDAADVVAVVVVAAAAARGDGVFAVVSAIALL